jgi:hypothetical protein
MTMRRVPPTLATMFVILLAGCAGPAKLAERSHAELARGDLRKAYETARRALEKDSSHPDARAAFGEAATALATDFRTRVGRLAQIDTVAAARVAIEFRDFRAEIAHQPVPIAIDPDDLETEAVLCEGAARVLYRSAEQSLTAERPKEAYRRFLESEDFDPGYADVGRRVPEALERALTRVAILPFENQTDVRDLSPELAERMVHESARRTGSPALFFTRVVDLETVFEGTTVAELHHMTRDRALAIGRRLDADRVVYGRFTGLRVDNDTYDFTVPVFRKQVDKVVDGPDRVRWIESSLQVLARERHVRVTMEYEVLDTHSGEIVATHEEPREAYARVVWTDYRAEGNCDAYRLIPDDPRAPERERGRGSQERWKQTMGSWSLPSFLEKARTGPARHEWSREYRGEFAADTRERPVYLAVLPGVDDLVFGALRAAEEPLIGTLRELDPLD